MKKYAMIGLMMFVMACNNGNESTEPVPADKPLSKMTLQEQQQTLSGLNNKTWKLVKVTDKNGAEVLYGVPLSTTKRPYSGEVTFRYAPTTTAFGTIDLVNTDGDAVKGLVWEKKTGNTEMTCSQGQWGSKLQAIYATEFDKTCLVELTSKKAVVDYQGTRLLTFEVK